MISNLLKKHSFTFNWLRSIVSVQVYRYLSAEMLYDVGTENIHEPFSLVILNIYWCYSYVHESIRGRNT